MVQFIFRPVILNFSTSLALQNNQHKTCFCLLQKQQHFDEKRLSIESVLLQVDDNIMKIKLETDKLIQTDLFSVGASKHRGSILAYHSAAPDSNPDPPKIFSLYCLVCEQYWDQTHLVLSKGFLQMQLAVMLVLCSISRLYGLWCPVLYCVQMSGVPIVKKSLGSA